MLNQEILSDFMNSFLGYGDFDADTWFIGMEEGGGDSVQEVETRIGTWANRGKRVLEDCAEYHHAIRAGHLFTPPVKRAQPTWDWLMRAQLRCSIPDDHIDPRRSAFFMARSVLGDIQGNAEC